jgi:hypothetical protein
MDTHRFNFRISNFFQPSYSIEDVTRFYTEKWENEVLERRMKNKTDRKISMLSKEYLKL